MSYTVACIKPAPNEVETSLGSCWVVFNSILSSSTSVIPKRYMKRVFVEAEDFKEKVDALDEKGLLQKIQSEILKDPEAGVLVQGTGGIRKFRIAAKGKGKSGGVRVFYLDIPTKEKCYLLFILEKSEAENINAEEKRELKEVALLLKK